MSLLLGLFADNLLPIFLMAAVGFVLAASMRLEARSLAMVTFHAFSPCLVFDLITHSELGSADMARMAGFAVTAVVVTALVAWAVSTAMALPRTLTAAVVLTSMLSNAGNYGLSLNMFAFGEAALAHAGIYFAASVALTYTAGVVVASLGSADLRTALTSALKVPTVYAVLLAVVFKALGLGLPTPVERSVAVLGDAAIPAMLVLLGMQLRLAGTVLGSRHLAPAIVLRLLVGPAVGVALVPLFGLSGPARQAGVIETAMPTAVVTTVLAEAYDLEPAFVTQAVVLSTLLSPLTLTPLLAWLSGG